MSESYALLTAEINPNVANNFIAFLTNQAQAGITKLTLAMNCPGGNTVAGIAIHNAMLAMPYDITTHNIGNVDSIATVIFLAGEERYACATSTFMFHGVGFPGKENERLEEKNLRAKLDTVISDHKRIAHLMESRTALSTKQGMSLLKEQRTQDSAWAKSNGLVTDIRDFVFPAGQAIQLFA